MHIANNPRFKAGQPVLLEGRYPVTVETYRCEFGQWFYNVVIGNYRIFYVRDVDLVRIGNTVNPT